MAVTDEAHTSWRRFFVAFSAGSALGLLIGYQHWNILAVSIATNLAVLCMTGYMVWDQRRIKRMIRDVGASLAKKEEENARNTRKINAPWN